MLGIQRSSKLMTSAKSISALISMVIRSIGSSNYPNLILLYLHLFELQVGLLIALLRCPSIPSTTSCWKLFEMRPTRASGSRVSTSGCATLERRSKRLWSRTKWRLTARRTKSNRFEILTVTQFPPTVSVSFNHSIDHTIYSRIFFFTIIID